jgi:fatty acid desaturase
MGKGSQNNESVWTENQNSVDQKVFTWDQVKQHNKRDDVWIVVNNNVYNVTEFQKKHPGGARLINFYAGKDATEPFLAYHKDQKLVQKYLKPLCVGKFEDELKCKARDSSNDIEEVKRLQRKHALINDFELLRQKAIQMDLFKPNGFFFGFMCIHAILLHVIGYALIIKYGTSFIPYALSVLCHVTGHMQSAWISHDSGHHSVFKSMKANHIFQSFLMCCMKGVSYRWWNSLHYAHHTVTNLIGKDGDITTNPLMVLGTQEPVRVAEKNAKQKNKGKRWFPYTSQHKYFFLLAAMLIPVYFEYAVVQYVKKRKLYLEMVMLSMMYITFSVLTVPTLGFFGSLVYFLIIRSIESCWYTWVTQMNHVAMNPHYDDETDNWFTLQLKGTCNVGQSLFNDWFTGHLNFQIEHHLFPTMPRHNYYKIQPYVIELCKKYDIEYIEKPLGVAFADIVSSLETYGKIWKDAYDELAHTD